jgi:hypothetical protein
MTTGYKTVTPNQIGNLLHALTAGHVPWVVARVWFACLEMVAIREAAQRVRHVKRDKRKIEPHFKRTELMELTGLNARAVGKAVVAIQRSGLVSLTPKAITVADSPLPDAGETIRTISGGRSPKRPIPVPRALLRFLAEQPKPALGKVMVGYVCRGLSIDRQGGAIRGAGTVKASWLAETFGLSLRSVRYAQAELRRTGWIPKDTGSRQGKLNRHGAWFCIKLDWVPPVASAKLKIAPPRPEKGTPVAPPNEDRKTPSESKNQKPGVFGIGNGRDQPPMRTPLTGPSLSNVRIEDLQDRERLRTLHRQAVERGWLRDCEADTLNFFAAAVRARTTTTRDPVRVFVALLRSRQWAHITQSQESAARAMLRVPNFSRPAASSGREAVPVRVGAFLPDLLPKRIAGIPTAMYAKTRAA